MSSPTDGVAAVIPASEITSPAADAALPAAHIPPLTVTPAEAQACAAEGGLSRGAVLAGIAALLARGVTLFIGLFTIVNVAGVWRSGSAYDFNIWWLSLPAVDWIVGAVLFTVAGVVLVAYALAPAREGWRRWVTVAVMLGCAAVAAYDCYEFYATWRSGLIAPAMPLPFSAVLCALLVAVAAAAAWAPARPRRRWLAAAAIAATAAACAVLFPLAQILFFGTTDYRRPAGVAVVFGAQVHGGGVPSTSLKDRMATAVELYEDKLVRRVLVSGGVGESGYNEALVMRDMARAAGVPARAIIIDSSGVSTEATVRNSLPFFDLGGDVLPSVVAVSQFYHLPRIKLAYQRVGWDVLTVPAATSQPIPQTPRLVLREVPAFWLYYLRAVLR